MNHHQGMRSTFLMILAERSVCLSPRGRGGCTPYHGLYGEAPPEGAALQASGK